MAKIERFFATQTELSFVGSSILFVREGDGNKIRNGTAAAPVVRMIDFAHTLPPESGPCKDVGYHYGAANMYAILQSIANGTGESLKVSMNDHFQLPTGDAC